MNLISAERRGFVFLTVLRRGNLDGNVGGLKSGDLVLVRILGIGFVRGTVGEVQVQSVGPLADQQTFARQADAGRGRVASNRRGTRLSRARRQTWP